MPQAEVSDGVSIAYDTFGEPGDPPVLLVIGFGAQLTVHDDFCAMLAGRGRYVIRYDNRDCGLSTKFDDHPVDIGAFIAAVRSGDIAAAQAMAPYSLRDMADDGLGLLTALGIERAHVVGSSMGGMIAQTMAIAHPDRVLTLTSMMSSTGEPEYGRSTPAAQQALFAPPPADREDYIAASEKQLTWSSKRYANPGAIRELAARSYDRAYYPAGACRQLARHDPGRLSRRGAADPDRAHPRDPRPGRHAHRPQRRQAHRRARPRRPAAADPGHGPRPASRAVGHHHDAIEAHTRPSSRRSVPRRR